MEKFNERPICHRAEDLVTYLYGEATAEEARDFTSHMHGCDACRAEFALFNNVHESIVAWRSEVLGPAPVRQVEVAPAVTNPDARATVVREGRKLSALAALREFFTVSPVWLRGAAAFAGVLLCVLLVFAAFRLWQKPAAPANNGAEAQRKQREFDNAVQKKVDEKLAQINKKQDDVPPLSGSGSNKKPRPQVAVNRQPNNLRSQRLSRQEREQLAADLRLTSPAEEEEMLLAFPEQEHPNQ